MNGQPTSRLLWKLWREMRGLLVFQTLAPMIAFPVAGLDLGHGWLWQFVSFTLAMSTAFILPMLFGVAGSNLGSRDWDSETYGVSHLPVPALPVWMVSFAIPLVAALAFGAWAGGWALAFAPPAAGSSSVRLGTIISYCALWSAVTAGCYSLGYAVAQAANIQTGAMMASMFALLGTIALTARDLAIGRPDDLPGEVIAWMVIFSVPLAAMAASAVWVAVRRKTGAARLASPIVAAVVAGALFVGPGLWASYTKNLAGAGFPPLESADGALAVQMTGQSGDGRGGGTTTCSFTDRRTGEKSLKPLPLVVQPLGFANQTRQAVLAYRQVGRARMTIGVWDLASGIIQQAASIPYNPRAKFELGTQNTYTGGFVGWVSPDGGWLLLRVRPSNGSGEDLWLIDLKRGGAKLVYPNFEVWGWAAQSVVWSSDGATLTGPPPQLRVNFSSASASEIRVLGEGIR